MRIWYENIVIRRRNADGPPWCWTVKEWVTTRLGFGGFLRDMFVFCRKTLHPTGETRRDGAVDVARSRAGEKKKAPNQSRRESSALASSLADCCCLLRPPPKELAFFSDTCCGRRQGTRLSSIDHSKLHWTNCQSGLCQNRSARPPLATFSIEESFSCNNYC